VTHTVAPIVEGHGDVAALRVLLGKIAPAIRVARPVRFPKSKLVKVETELVRAVRIAGANIRPGETGLILLLIDGDEDCPAKLAPELLASMNKGARDIHCLVVFAVREFESWIVGGHPDLDIADPEHAGKAKGRIEKINGGLYQQSVDQARLASRIEVDRLRPHSPSFRRFAERIENFVNKP